MQAKISKKIGNAFFSQNSQFSHCTDQCYRFFTNWIIFKMRRNLFSTLLVFFLQFFNSVFIIFSLKPKKKLKRNQRFFMLTVPNDDFNLNIFTPSKAHSFVSAPTEVQTTTEAFSNNASASSLVNWESFYFLRFVLSFVVR